MAIAHQSGCNLCGGTEHEQVGSRDRDGQPLNTVICTGCGLVFTSPLPTEEQLAAYYSTQYRRSYKGVDKPKPYHVYRAGKSALRRLDRIRPLLAEGGRVLDIGSGGGEFVYLMTKRGYQVTGIEPDLGYGGYSIEEYGIDVRQAPLYAIDLPSGEFDLITTHHVVEHLCNPFQCFVRAHALLRPGGVFVVDVPNVESKVHAPHHRFHYGHVHNFNPKTMEWMGARAGFDVHPIGMKSTNDEVRAAFIKKTPGFTTVDMEANYRHVRDLLKRHTNLRHYLSLTPLRRLGESLGRLVTEPHRQVGTVTGREILDPLYDAASTGQVAGRPRMSGGAELRRAA